MDNECARRKGQALVEYLNKHIKRLKVKSMSQLRYTKFIPCKMRKPENYPDSLKLFGEDSCGLVSMEKDNSQNVWSSKNMNVVGAIAPIAKRLSDTVMKAFNLATEPPLEKVLDHLEIVLECYDPALGDQDYSAATSDIYKYLAQVKHSNMSNSCRERLSTMKFIWINPEYGFQGIKDIWTKKSKSDIDIMPYRFCLPKLLINIEKIVLNLGSVQTQTSQMLVDVLKEIQGKHYQAQHQKINPSDDVQKDLGITMHVINTLKTRTPKPNGILLPIHDESESMFLTLKPIKECTYCNVDMSLDIDIDGGSVDDNIYFVHRDISEDTAFKLEVPLLADRILAGAEGIDFKFGQNESLTKRLHNILKGYSSLSVPKEIIQNAEDAHATKVMFLYDERHNQDFKTSLIDPKMASLQGPALWAYNDSKFTEGDFKNIQDLGGATKEGDESKLGRFGLGFNSVYNFTDVPSFISGNTAVFLDPHETYLGKRRLGLKVDLSSVRGRRMLQTMKDQFLPFDGIFGCQLGAGRTEEICGGTLFRLPLRTEEQASESKIKNQSFTRSDMQSYLRDIAKTAGNLLQFTQNIKCVEIYHLTNISPVDQCKLLLSVAKRTEEQCVVREGVAEPIQPHVNMISFFADKWKESNGTCDEDYTIEKVDMCLENTKQFHSLFGVKQCNEKIRWQITWTMGGNDSQQFARLASVKGLIPLASTAIALTTCGEKNDIITVCDLSKCPSGFYDAGHLYCFLPLPLPPTSFAMHISAPFALTDDRQHLCALSEDDRNSVQGRWNQVLQQDVLGTAIVTTLDGLKEAQLADSTAYHKLWPRVNLSGDDTEQSITIDVARNFYAVICRGNHQIFLEESSGNYAAFSDARFLSADLAYHKTVGKSAVGIFQTFWKSDTVIDLPEEIFESFANTSGDLFITRVLDTKEFFEQVFFPNIMDDSMEFHDREVLTHFALSLFDPEIDNLLQQSSCIPCRPTGSMKIPGQLVHPKGKAASMFSDADEVFPSDTFTDNVALDRLCSLGMIKDDLPWDMMISRLETVEMIHAEDTVAANGRCLRILQYLNQSNPKHRKKRKFDECSDEIKNQFISTKFLPILQKPADWPFEWNAKDTDTLSTPKSMFLFDAKDLVGCSHMVLDSYKLEGLHSEKDVLKWLGVLGKKDIPIEIVQDQLLIISRQISQGVDVNRVCTQIINNVYSNLDDFCRKHGHEDPDLLQVLQNNPVILHDKTFIYPKQAAFNLKFNLQPHLFQIAPLMANSYKELFITLGVQDTFTVVRLQEEVGILSSKHRGGCMSDKEVELYVHMVTLLADTKGAHTNDNSLPDILLPDDKGSLYLAHDLCINDCSWIDKNSEMKYVHSTVSHRVAMTCGVKTKIHAKIETIAKPLSVVDFGQTEKLTDRLKGILGGYPRDASIMKELLQNADDAGATELRFIKDFRSHPTERVFGENWKLLQGPALCVWNNSSFTEQDLAGIQALGVGSKSDDPLKTGQYGVGFNAVYHLTDVPSFLTRGPNTPETLCVLDPNIKYAPWATAISPGCKFTDLMEVQHSFKDVYGCYLSDAADLNETGTLFRLPLRTKAMAEISQISKEEVPLRGINALLEEFQLEAADSLLFLHNVRSISIQSVRGNGDIVTEFSVVAKMSESDEQKLNEFKSGLPKNANTATDTEAFETTILLETSDSKGKDLKWLVGHRYGFDDFDSVPGILKECMQDGRIGMLPRGGVAVPIQRQADQFKGKVFCMLPLRIETGLPMHINGHFALDHEARGNLWHGPHQYRTVWNESIIQHVIVPAFTTALSVSRPDDNELTYEKALTLLHKYSKRFPVINDCNDDYWKLLSKSFYRGLLLNSISILPVVVPSAGLFPRVSEIRKSCLPVTIEWMPLSSSHEAPVYFNNIRTAKLMEREEKETLVELLKDCGMHIVDMPLDIVQQFVDSGLQDQVEYTSPTMVIRFLKSENNKCQAETLPCDVKETPMQDLNALILVTRYCTEDPSFSKELNGLPLLLRQDMTLSVFQTRSPIIVTDALELVKGSPERMLHIGICSLYVGIIDETDVLKRLEISTFAELLPYTMGHLHSNVPVLWTEKKSPSERWIKKAWKFLHEEIKRTSGGQHRDVSVIKIKLTPLGEWCLLPGRTQTHTGSELKLYPVNTADTIFNLAQFDDIYKRYISAFSKLSIPQLDVSILMEIGFYAVNETVLLTKTLVVSLDNPIAVLKSISHIFTTGVEITTDIGQTVLQYLCSHLTTFKEDKSLTTVTMLKSLVIFEDIAGKLRNTNARTVYGVSAFDSIPVEGMETWSFKLGMTLLKCPDFVKEMLTFIGIHILSPVELYEKCILKGFANLPRPAQVVHLKFVKNNLLKTYYGLSDPKKKLIGCLKNLSFIVAPDGSSHTASEYFSRKETLFDKFLSNEHFPPQPFDDPEWEEFLQLCGLVTKVSQAKFLEFARQVEEEGSTSIKKETKAKAKLLISHLFQDRSDLFEGRFLQTIKDIKFVLPHQPSDNEENIMVKEIHPQIQQGKLICYSGSTTHDHFNTVWSSSCMLQSYADPNYFKIRHNARERSKIDSLLGIQREPGIDKVVHHIQNICKSLAQKQPNSLKAGLLHDIILKVLESNYKFLLDKKSVENSVMKQKLTEMKCVFLPEDGIFVRPKDIVLDMTKEEAVKGYIYRAPVYFGLFFELFKRLGASSNVSANHYATVLEIMAHTTKDTKLNPNELETVEKVTARLFDSLKNDEQRDLSVRQLFLLDEEKKLAVSNELVVADNEILKRRMHSLKRRYFIGFHKLGISVTDMFTTFNLLSKRYRPKVLTKMTSERLHNLSRHGAHVGQLAIKYKDHIANRMFLHGLIRLINDQRRLKALTALENDELLKIEKMLAGLVVKEVKKLSTILVLLDNDQDIENSTEERICFLDDTNEPLTVYIHSTKKMKKVLHSWLARAINKLTGNHLTVCINQVESMLDLPVEEIKGFLDFFTIAETGYICGHFDNTVLPPLGTDIDEEFHWMLDNGFYIFEEEEYVGFEKFDPLTEEEYERRQGSGDGIKPEYIYAKVKKIIDETATAIHARYLIDVGEAELKEVCGLDLYKFIRIKDPGKPSPSGTDQTALVLSTRNQDDRNENQQYRHENQQETRASYIKEDVPLDMDTVLKEIREILKEAWKMPDKKQRDKVKKRLLFKWHPDKNKDNKEFCTKVFQRIQNYVEMLELGKNIDEETGSDTKSRSKSSRSGFDEWFYEEMNRRSRQHRDHYEHREEDDGFDDFFGFRSSSSRQSARPEPRPQPEEAKRWIRQAMDDLKIARNTLQTGTGHNWSCFQCYMVCEKAVKGLLYNKDSREADEYRTENLSSVARKLGNVAIRKRSEDLLTIVRDKDHTQYPTKSDHRTPYDKFTQEQATDACRIAEGLLEKALEVAGFDFI